MNEEIKTQGVELDNETEVGRNEKPADDGVEIKVEGEGLENEREISGNEKPE